MDSIDAVMVDFDFEQPQVIASSATTIEDNLRQELFALARSTDHEIQRMGQLDVQLGHLFAHAVNQLLAQTGYDRHQIKAIGSHGQTVRHQPYTSRNTIGFSYQIGDPNIIAQETGITTIADFRRRDIAAGGQGAPLLPAFIADFMHNPDTVQAVVNIGGMANITLLPNNIDAVSGFDTGPGNVLIDTYCQQELGIAYDRSGKRAQAGKISQALLNQLLNDDYFSQPAPKSTGREYFSLNWLRTNLSTISETLSHDDILATCTELTAVSIAQAISDYSPVVEQIILYGGGVHNDFLRHRLASYLEGRPVSTTAQHGIAPDDIEATAFAWMARQTLSGKTSNLPIVTGAKQKVILGAIYQNL